MKGLSQHREPGMQRNHLVRRLVSNRDGHHAWTVKSRLSKTVALKCSFMPPAVKEMESKVGDTAAFSTLPQEEQQELEQTLSQNRETHFYVSHSLIRPDICTAPSPDVLLQTLTVLCISTEGGVQQGIEST